MTTEETQTPSFYEDEDNLRKLCDFLRSGEGPPVREALLMEKRVYYLKGKRGAVVVKNSSIVFIFGPFKVQHYDSLYDFGGRILIFMSFFTVCIILYIITGEKLVNFLTEPKKGTKWPKNLPRFDSRQDAIAVCKELCKLQYLLRSEKRGKGELGVSLIIIFLVSCDVGFLAGLSNHVILFVPSFFELFFFPLLLILDDSNA